MLAAACYFAWGRFRHFESARRHAHAASASMDVVAGPEMWLYSIEWVQECGDMSGLVISGGRVVDPASGMDAIGDVALVGGRIAAVGTGLGSAERTIDATG